MIEMPETRYVETRDGTRLAYQVFGSGKRDILYLPGHIGHVEIHWEDPLYAAFLRGLGSFARVIAVDRRGQGLSDRLSPGDLPPPEVLVDDILSVMSEIRSRDTVVLGHDEGAQIAILLAASHPDAVRGLVLYGSSPSGAWTPAAPWGDTEEEWLAWLSWIIPRWGSVESAVVDVQETAPERVGDEAFTRWVAKLYRYGVSPNAASALYRLAIGLDVTDVLPAVRVPTLVAHRTGDRMTPIEAGRFMAARIPGAHLVELPGEDHFPNGPTWGALVEVIRDFVDGPQDRPTGNRRLATVLFTDIVGSTARSAELGDAAWKVLLESHHSAVRRELQLHGGHEISTAGDGFFATFEGPAAAASCARAIVDAVRRIGLEIRAGVHTGEVETIDDDVGGIAVTIGARIGAIAGPSEVLVSSTVKDLTIGSGLTFEDAGRHQLKGVPDRWRLYRVVEAPSEVLSR